MPDRLAIKGGKPVRKKFLPYGHQWIDDNDIKAVSTVLKNDWITQGPKIREFEQKLAKFSDAKYAVAFSSGTAALHAACAVAGITKGDEVITTPITFVASVNAVLYCGAKPVFADIKEDTLDIDPDKIEKKITKKTKAIIPVDFAGQPCDYHEIKKIARENNLLVIQDAAHSLGAEYKGQKIGSLSDMTVFSFHPVKIITTGEGGMIVTNNKDFCEKLKNFRHHGIIKDKSTEKKGGWYYEAQSLGYNLRITDFQCALGISQMEKINRYIERRQNIASRYNKAFEGIDEIITPKKQDNAKSAYHIYVIQLKTDFLKADRKTVFDALRAENIGAHVHYIPVYYQPYYELKLGFRKGICPNAERYYERCITLPIFPKMTDADVGDVIKAVKKVIRYYRKD